MVQPESFAAEPAEVTRPLQKLARPMSISGRGYGLLPTAGLIGFCRIERRIFASLRPRHPDTGPYGCALMLLRDPEAVTLT